MYTRPDLLIHDAFQKNFLDTSYIRERREKEILQIAPVFGSEVVGIKL